MTSRVLLAMWLTVVVGGVALGFGAAAAVFGPVRPAEAVGRSKGGSNKDAQRALGGRLGNEVGPPATLVAEGPCALFKTDAGTYYVCVD